MREEVEEALAMADRMTAEKPHIVQPGRGYDRLAILASEVRRLRERCGGEK